MASLRVIFMGTAELACASLEALTVQPSIQIAAVVTQPDRPKGRDLKLQPSPVKELALLKGLRVVQPERARDPRFVEELRRYQLDLIVVAAYGQILPRAILEIPRHGCLNVHASLLPKYRGAAPIQWAILNDEAQTGVTIMRMDAGLDTGEILSQAATPILPEDNAQILQQRLASMGAELLVQTLPDYVEGRILPSPQPADGASYARKLTKEDGRLNWALSARALWNRVRAFTPWPGAFFFHGVEPKARRVKISEAKVEETLTGPPGQVLQADKTGLVVGCAQQALRLLSLQPEGGRRLTVQQFLAGYPIERGDQFT